MTNSALIRSFLEQKPIYDVPPAIEMPAPPAPKRVESKPPPSEIESLFDKFAPDLLIDPPIVLFWEHESDLPFAEKIAAALSDAVAQTECRPWDGDWASESCSKIMLVPGHLFDMQPHTLKEGSPALFALAKMSVYHTNMEMKRALWKKLQSLKDLLV